MWSFLTFLNWMNSHLLSCKMTWHIIHVYAWDTALWDHLLTFHSTQIQWVSLISPLYMVTRKIFMNIYCTLDYTSAPVDSPASTHTHTQTQEEKKNKWYASTCRITVVNCQSLCRYSKEMAASKQDTTCIFYKWNESSNSMKDETWRRGSEPKKMKSNASYN